MRLAGRRASITGGGSGIGRETAMLLGREGAKVMVSGRRRPTWTTSVVTRCPPLVRAPELRDRVAG